MLPQEMGCGSGVTCWRRLRDWHEAGVWEALHRTLLEHLQHADRLNWDRACMDSASIKAKKGDRPLARTLQTAAGQAPSDMS